ncbi:MAG: hypothetical protein ABIP06_02510 [Pyrinomonadaceae bacterium]
MSAIVDHKIRRHPGFRFESRTETREDVLPRMDIAVFVGFAATGPIGIPVALESVEQFDVVFGKDLPLVWDSEKSRVIYALLAPTVRMFFRNGGTRCWVIRTARVAADEKNPFNRAAYNFLPLQGIAGFRFDDENDLSEILPAFARARSKGSWSDDLKVATVTLSTAIRCEKIENADEGKTLHISVAPTEKIKPGDLLECDFSNSNLTLILAADKIEKVKSSNESSIPISPTIENLKIISKRFIWLKKLPEEDFPESQNFSVKMWTRQNSANSEDLLSSALETYEAELSFEKSKNDSASADFPTKIRLKFSASLTDIPAEGSLLIAESDKQKICLQVETALNLKTEFQETVELICNGFFIFKTAELPSVSPKVKRLGLEIWIKKGEKVLTRLNNLGFNPAHERFWGNLPVDDDLYSFSENGNQNSPEITSWTRTGEFAKSQIAGNALRDGIFVPVFTNALSENYLGTIKSDATKLQRDGLEVFDEELFLDEKLKNTGLNNLLNDAEFIRYLSPRPRRLWGIHSALAPETTTIISAESLPTDPAYASFSLDEATIISVPDALHRGWFRDENSGAVSIVPISFESPLRAKRKGFHNCNNEKSFPEIFFDCDQLIIDVPKNFTVSGGKVSGGTFSLVWEHGGKPDKNLKFLIEESATPEFEFPQEIYRDKNLNFKVSEHGAGVFYYRIRAEIGDDVSDWSNGLEIKIPSAESWTVKLLDKNEPEDSERKYKTDVLLAVQRALLRMCAARGDIFAVLDLPAHFEKDEAVKYIATLKNGNDLTNKNLKVVPFSADEKTVLSYGAVYYPWVLAREESFEAVRKIPPCGAVSGVFAKHSVGRGAWVAPANEPLQNILGLAKDFPRDGFLDFQDSLINLVRHEPNGFLVLSSETLSDEFDLQQINVRRLLCLLRRLAVKHGAEYVFEPNNESFRRSVQRGFRGLLDKMFVRGAFAGTTPANSYQVVVSDTINNLQSVEQGRFIVELRVAPSLPLKFVTVRLINSGGRTSVSETI